MGNSLILQQGGRLAAVWVVKKTSPFYQFPSVCFDTSWMVKISRTWEPLGTVFALIIFNGVNIGAYAYTISASPFNNID